MSFRFPVLGIAFAIAAYQRTLVADQTPWDRYVAGDLTKSESDDFEDRLVWDKELVEEVDIAARLREGLRAMAEDPGEANVPDPVPRAGFFASGRLALAASFAAGALATSLIFNQMATTIPDGKVPTQVVALELLRGNTGQEIAVGSDGMTVLMVSTDGSQTSYDVELMDAAGTNPIWKQSGLVPGYTTSLAVGIDNRLIQPGQYALRIFADVDGERRRVREIPFHTVASE